MIGRVVDRWPASPFGRRSFRCFFLYQRLRLAVHRFLRLGRKLHSRRRRKHNCLRITARSRRQRERRSTIEGSHKVVQFLGRSLKSGIGCPLPSVGQRRTCACLIKFRLVGQRVSWQVAVRLRRTIARQPRVVGVIGQIAQQLRMAGYVALRGRFESDVANVLWEVGMFRHIAKKWRMSGNGADGQRKRATIAH